MAKQDAEGSEQGRLLRDALEFNKPRSEIKQQADKAPAEAQVEYKAGDMLGNKYRVIEVLGRGKAGVTYKVRLSLFLLQIRLGIDFPTGFQVGITYHGVARLEDTIMHLHP